MHIEYMDFPLALCIQTKFSCTVKEIQMHSIFSIRRHVMPHNCVKHSFVIKCIVALVKKNKIRSLSRFQCPGHFLLPLSHADMKALFLFMSIFFYGAASGT